MKRFLKPAGIFIFVMLIPLFTTNITDAEESSTTLFLRATQYEQQGDYEQAIALYKRILTKENSATVTLKMYELEVRRENKAEAEKIIVDAYSAYPDNAQVAFYYGLFLTNQAETYEKGSADYKRYYGEAVKAFQNALRVEQTEQFYVAVAVAAQGAEDYALAEKTYKQLIEELDRPDYYRAIAVVNLEQNQRTEAIKNLEKAIELTDDAQSYLILAEIYLKADEVNKAVQYLSRMAELYPGIPATNQYLGEYYQNAGDYEKALRYYWQAVESSNEPGSKAALLRLIGAMAIDKEDYKTAYEAFSMAIEATPRDQQLYYYAGYSADMLDDFDTAQAIYEKGLAAFPEFSVLRKRLAFHYLTADDYDKVLSTLAPIDEVERDVQYYLLISSAYEGRKDIGMAVSSLQEGIQVHTYNASLFMSLAAKYEQQGRHDDSIALLEKALKYEPESAAIQNFLGYILADLNRNLDRAFALITSALKQEPENYAYIDSLAWVHFRRGEYKKARELMVKALKINPKDKELIDHMEQIEKALKK